MNSDPNHYVILGQVVGVFGIKGWVKVRSDTDPPTNILNYSPWYLAKNTEYHPLAVVAGQRHNKGLIAQLDGCEDRDAAAALVGSKIAILRVQLPATAEGEYYWSDLIGLDVYTQQDEYLGRVTNLMQTGANDVLVVQGDEEILIPYVWNHYIYKVDLVAGRIEVDWDTGDEDSTSDEREEL
jgi:16S rRNA processing protein RimM